MLYVFRYYGEGFGCIQTLPIFSLKTNNMTTKQQDFVDKLMDFNNGLLHLKVTMYNKDVLITFNKESLLVYKDGDKKYTQDEQTAKPLELPLRTLLRNFKLKN